MLQQLVKFHSCFNLLVSLLNIHTFKLDNYTTEHVSGNRCVNGLGDEQRHSLEKLAIPNVVEWQRKRVFTYTPLSVEEAKRGIIGIPRVLLFYEDFPFWETTFKNLGFRVVLSQESTDKLFAKGMSTIPVFFDLESKLMIAD